MKQLVEDIPEEAIALLCRSFRWQVMCVAQYAVRPPGFAISYERGRSMPMVRGSASKAVLAALPPRQLRRFYADHAAEAAEAGLGASWDEFRASVRAFRKAKVVVSHSEIDPGALGVSAPLADIDGAIGSIGVVVSASRLAHDANRIASVRNIVCSAAEAIAAELLK
jgi:DNA-binding IclR family transcriptional regulator